jgi:hypothetical protein
VSGFSDAHWSRYANSVSCSIMLPPVFFILKISTAVYAVS